VDSDPAKVRHVRAAVGASKVPPGTAVHIDEGDSRRLVDVPDGTVTAVVTDPPWGEYAGETYDLDALYSPFLRQLCRVCVPGARGVLLLHRENPVERMIRENGLAISVVEATPVLVAGRKATVLRLRVN
jgi:23S rRNA G2445 N2-methylase RlmL